MSHPAPTSLLATDGYKFSMAEAGAPLREEVFYYCHRKGGPQLIPFDAEEMIRRLLPLATSADYGYLASHDYPMGEVYKQAIARTASLRIAALPRGSWVYPREPIATLTGPSAIVSWVEPLLLQLNYRVQLATLACLDPAALGRELARVTCEAQRTIALETLDAVGVRAPAIVVDSDGYFERVRARARELVEIVEDGGRLFEVGLRSATGLDQHRIALSACKAAQVTRTSHVLGAHELGLTPVGTMGHEHVQRYGSDAAAFLAMRERRRARSSYLLDTYDTYGSGIPAAFALIAADSHRGDSIRYDSGDKIAQYRFAAARAHELGIRPVQIIEDGCDAETTRIFEALRVEVGWRKEEQFYGYGGYLVAGPMGSSLTRDRVAAVYKLSQSGEHPTMKFGNETAAGKRSVPGRPVVFRRTSGAGPIGLIGQEGEEVPTGYTLLTGKAPPAPFEATPARDDVEVGYSRATESLIEVLSRSAFRSRHD
jgi:nicotinic acid phosphoribosyltransferase